MNITSETTAKELTTVQVMDFVNNGIIKGRVTDIQKYNFTNYLLFRFEVYAENNCIYNTTVINIKRFIE